MNKRRVAFIHGRPKGHPTHAEYAKSINCDFFYEDSYLRWHDRPNSFKVRRYLSWIMNAIMFPSKDYDVILTECIRIPQLLMKWFGLLRGRKLIALMDDESLFFIKISRYPSSTVWLMRQFLRSADGLICVGDFQTELAKRIVPANKICTIFNGVEANRFNKLIKLRPNLDTKTILIIGNMGVEWREFYKGLDLAIEATNLVRCEIQSIKLIVVGTVSRVTIEKYLTLQEQDHLQFVGNQKDISKYLAECSLYLHPSRGEAWGISINEAMVAGVTPIVSEHTGAMEVVKQVSPELVSSLDLPTLSKKIKWFFDLPLSEKKKLSEKCKNVSQPYKEEKAIVAFNEAFEKLTKE